MDTQSAAAAARVQVQSSFPPPMFVDASNVGALRPRAPVSIDDLVPGVVGTVIIEGNCSKIGQQMRLEKIEVAWSKSAETVSPTFVPVNSTGGQ